MYFKKYVGDLPAEKMVCNRCGHTFDTYVIRPQCSKCFSKDSAYVSRLKIPLKQYVAKILAGKRQKGK